MTRGRRRKPVGLTAPGGRRTERCRSCPSPPQLNECPPTAAVFGMFRRRGSAALPVGACNRATVQPSGRASDH
jgi:hypothetical protein